MILRNASQYFLYCFEQSQLLQKSSVDDIKTAVEKIIFVEFASEDLFAVNIFEEESSVELVRVFVGQVAFLPWRPTVCRLLLDHFQKTAAGALLVRVFTAPV